MKAIESAETTQIHKIEASRYSFVILETFWDRILALRLHHADGSAIPESAVTELLYSAWGIVDFGFRFCKVVSQVRGLKHKDKRFTTMEKMQQKLTGVRNYIQHLDNETHPKTEQTYPILGALSWSAHDGQTSTTVCLGTLPPDCAMNTMPFSSQEKKYLDEIILHVGESAIELKQAVADLRGAFEYLQEWLEAGNMLQNSDAVANVLRAGPITQHIPAPWGRIRYVTRKLED